MPIGDEYKTIAEISLELGYNYSGWQRSSTADRLFMNIVDQIDGRNSPETALKRVAAVVRYLGMKKIGLVAQFDKYPAIPRQIVVGYTLTNALHEEDETDIGMAGKFSRALQTVYDEAIGHNDQIGVLAIWLNQAARGLNDGVGADLPPILAPFSSYRIGTGDAQINDGSNILVTAPERLRLQIATVNFSSLVWQLDGVDVPGSENNEQLNIDPTSVDDSGTYTAVVTNAYGSTTSAEFNVVVS